MNAQRPTPNVRRPSMFSSFRKGEEENRQEIRAQNGEEEFLGRGLKLGLAASNSPLKNWRDALCRVHVTNGIGHSAARRTRARASGAPAVATVPRDSRRRELAQRRLATERNLARPVGQRVLHPAPQTASGKRACFHHLHPSRGEAILQRAVAGKRAND